MEQWLEKMVELLRHMNDRNASDMHMSVGVPPYLRVNGIIYPTDFPPLSNEACENLLFSMVGDADRELYDRNKTLDFSFGRQDIGRFRFNLYQQRGTLAAAVRRFRHDIPTIETLGLPKGPMERFCNLAHGLVLICGPTGSGKTTTLAAMIDYINKNRNCHVISVEDPIEYLHRNIKSLVHQREIRRDTPNFQDALKYMLREDPDIVVIGEMRDLETISAAVTIAETGHLVLATLHTGDTSESIRRIVDVFPASQQTQIIAQLAGCLVGVMNQTLLPKLNNLERVLACEVMVVTPAIQNLIRENKIEQIYSHIQIGGSLGMKTMNQSLYEWVKTGEVSTEVALSRTPRIKELMKLLGMNYA